jgi:hypothetical protein
MATRSTNQTATAAYRHERDQNSVPGLKRCLCQGVMETANTSETSVNLHQTIQRYNPEDSHPHNQIKLQYILCLLLSRQWRCLCGLQRRVDFQVDTDVSEEHTVTIFSVLSFDTFITDVNKFLRCFVSCNSLPVKLFSCPCHMTRVLKFCCCCWSFIDRTAQTVSRIYCLHTSYAI